MITPLAEEVPELRRLNELRPRRSRRARRDASTTRHYVADFRRMWFRGKRGFTLARLKRWLRLDDNVLTRDLRDMTVDDLPGRRLERRDAAGGLRAAAAAGRRAGRARAARPRREAFAALPEADRRRLRVLPAPAARATTPSCAGGRSPPTATRTVIKRPAVQPAAAAGLQRQRRAPDQHGVLRRQPAHAEDRAGRRPGAGRARRAPPDAGAGGVLRASTRDASRSARAPTSW